jgi:hypothetical protein
MQFDAHAVGTVCTDAKHATLLSVSSWSLFGKLSYYVLFRYRYRLVVIFVMDFVQSFNFRIRIRIRIVLVGAIEVTLRSLLS